jgi:hypothetical protein
MEKIVGWAVSEEIGIGIPNPRGVIKFSGPPEIMELVVTAYEYIEQYCEKNGINMEKLTDEELYNILDCRDSL